jgi:integrase
VDRQKSSVSKRRQWPRTVTVGSSSVKVYRVAHATNKTGWTYVVSHSTKQGRRRQKFSTQEEALEEARLLASKLAAGRVEGSSFSRGERDEYVAALRIVGSYPLTAALKEWKKAFELCGSSLLSAAQAWHDANGNAPKVISVDDLVAAFLRDKERSGVDTSAGYDRTLPRVAQAFAGTPVHTLSSQRLKEWLHAEFVQPDERYVNASTFNSHRRRMVTLWKWARDEGYLPRNAQTEIEQVKTMREEAPPIGILTVVDYAKVLEVIRESYPNYLATAVLAGFAGLRRTELHAQRWDQIDLKRGFLKVTKAKRNTPSMRMVHLCPAAVEWLILCKPQGDLIAPAWGLDFVRKCAREAKIPCPKNAFRHSFISYRVAMTGNVDETALEAGNSRDIIFRHYRELVGKEEGSAWFNLGPTAVKLHGTIARLPAQATG